MFSKYDSNSGLLQKFIYITGAMDFLVGAGTWAGALQFALAETPVKGQVVPLMTLGMFLMMAAACLMWASEDMKNRAPVIFWQGLVRLTAVSAVIYSVPRGLSDTWEYGLVAFDGTIGLVLPFDGVGFAADADQSALAAAGVLRHGDAHINVARGGDDRRPEHLAVEVDLPHPLTVGMEGVQVLVAAGDDDRRRGAHRRCGIDEPIGFSLTGEVIPGDPAAHSAEADGVDETVLGPDVVHPFVDEAGGVELLPRAEKRRAFAAAARIDFL